MRVCDFRRPLLFAAILFAANLGLTFAGASSAEACPMCAETVAADDNLPRAYMYSILFMISMPAVLFTGFGFAIYRAIKRHEAAGAAGAFVHHPVPELALEPALPGQAS